MLLNDKSVLDCNESEEVKHYDEIQSLIEKLYDLPNYKCAIVYKYLDEGHQNKEDDMQGCFLHDCFEMVEYADIKNGIDMTINADGLLTFVAYGQSYIHMNKRYLKKTAIVVMPYDKNRNSIDISYIFR